MYRSILFGAVLRWLVTTHVVGQLDLKVDQPSSTPRKITFQDLPNIDWTTVDRRDEEQWHHLYGFGEKFHDIDISNRPWNDQQIDLDFFFPFMGFRFNYTFVYPEGFIAFSYPNYIQPPYTFPNPQWPDQPDPSLIAAFMQDQTYMYAGEHKISHVWYRVISRPYNLIGNRKKRQNPFDHSSFPDRYYKGQLLRMQEGRLEDPEFLDVLSRDIQQSMVGARGFTADYALVITWERMAYGGSPRNFQANMYEQVKRWQNTYQLVIATDEVHSYVMHNYANINWTSSTSAGALFGRGGKQSAIVGYNGGNGTGFVQLPYSAEGNAYKLRQFGSTATAGRWISRVDEVIEYGGCTNTSTGLLKLHTKYGNMLGGFALNVSGPCFKEDDNIKMEFFDLTIDCIRLDMAIARCIIPVGSLSGIGRKRSIDVKLSRDGGKTYPYWTKFYVVSPAQASEVKLINDPIKIQNSWTNPDAENLTLKWSALNISNTNEPVDIKLFGYWEDAEDTQLIEIGQIVSRNVIRSGTYSFDPRKLTKLGTVADGWKRFRGGVIQVRVSDDSADTGDGLYWSDVTPFGWYFKDVWKNEYGDDWALDLCLDWVKHEELPQFTQVKPLLICPCTLDQALADFGRFAPKQDCDSHGDALCYYTKGASHCVVSTEIDINIGTQMCCYDHEGWLMFSQDFEYNSEYLRFYSAGVPYRAHPWGIEKHLTRQPHIPTLSNFHNDLLPYEFCCNWAGHCEHYFKLRESSTCQHYEPPKMGFAYGSTHFITYDGQQYTFSGKGYFVLTKMNTPLHDLMVQVRMEQPPQTIWGDETKSTVITGLAAKDNGSSIVQVFARKEYRRWRYKLDVYVDGTRYFFDKPDKKLQHFSGVSIRNPARNFNMSEIEIIFQTGVGVRVSEASGLLHVSVSLPPFYGKMQSLFSDSGTCSSDNYHTEGLLGTWNTDKSDDFLSPDCKIIDVKYPPDETTKKAIYKSFGQKWRVDGVTFRLLFQLYKPIYNPIQFANPQFTPVFDPWQTNDTSSYRSLIFSDVQVKVECQGVSACEYDYLTTGRHQIAVETLTSENAFKAMKEKGEKKLISCGPLTKNRGIIKYPLGNNYLDGVTVAFACKPQFVMLGASQRTCINGTWSEGELAHCKPRK